MSLLTTGVTHRGQDVWIYITYINMKQGHVEYDRWCLQTLAPIMVYTGMRFITQIGCES